MTQTGLPEAAENLAIPDPLTFGRAAGVSLQLYKARFGSLAAVYVPGMLVASCLGLLIPSAAGSPVALLLSSFVFAVIMPAIIGAFLSAAGSVLLIPETSGRRPGLAGAWSALRGTRLQVFAGSLVTALIASLTVFALNVTGLIFLYLLIGPPILVQTIVFERKSLAEAWSAIKLRLARRWSRPLGYMLSYAFGFFFLVTALTIAALHLLDGLGLPIREAADGSSFVYFAAVPAVLQGLFSGLLLPFLTAMAVALYVDSTRPHTTPARPPSSPQSNPSTQTSSSRRPRKKRR